MGGTTEDDVAPEINTTQTDEYFNLQSQLIQHKKNLKIRKNDHAIEVRSHQFTKDKLNTYLEKSDHLKQELSNHKEIHKAIAEKHISQISILQNSHSSSLEENISLKKKNSILQLEKASQEKKLKELQSKFDNVSSELISTS